LAVGQLNFGGLRKHDQRGGGHHETMLSVSARISDRWIVDTTARWLFMPPPMCSRQEVSAAHSTSAPVSSTQRVLSLSMANEVSAFLMAKVPPKPQHSLALGNSTRSMPLTARNSCRGASLTCSTRRLWQVG